MNDIKAKEHFEHLKKQRDNALKNCPFCNSRTEFAFAEKRTTNSYGNDVLLEMEIYAVCKDAVCRCRTNGFKANDTKDITHSFALAEEAWNYRFQPHQQ